MNLTTSQKIAQKIVALTPELREYAGQVNITEQASYDRWPEANGMRRHLFELASKAGISNEQVKFDLDHAPIDATGGRW